MIGTKTRSGIIAKNMQYICQPQCLYHMIYVRSLLNEKTLKWETVKYLVNYVLCTAINYPQSEAVIWTCSFQAWST